MLDLEHLKQGTAAAVNAAAKAGARLYDKSKHQVDRIALETKLAKAQRQLGALVYSLHKTGKENPDLVARYLETIAAVERELAACNAPSASAVPQPCDEQTTVLCPQCGTEVPKHAVFCGGCGEKLS